MKPRLKACGHNVRLRGLSYGAYPWGDNFDKTRANTNEGRKGATTPVGSYPSGASPCGAQEMAGNVCVWTSNLFKPCPYTPSDGREDLNSTEHCVLRGGSWDGGSGVTRAAYRVRGGPGYASLGVGLRVVLAVPSS